MRISIFYLHDVKLIHVTVCITILLEKELSEDLWIVIGTTIAAPLVIVLANSFRMLFEEKLMASATFSAGFTFWHFITANIFSNCKGSGAWSRQCCLKTCNNGDSYARIYPKHTRRCSDSRIILYSTMWNMFPFKMLNAAFGSEIYQKLSNKTRTSKGTRYETLHSNNDKNVLLNSRPCCLPQSCANLSTN